MSRKTVTLALLMIVAVGYAPRATPAPAPPPPTTFLAGTMIIPMDGCYQRSAETLDAHIVQIFGAAPAALRCNDAAAADAGVIHAYGLITRLVSAGVPVQWIIKPGKTDIHAVDFEIVDPTGGPVEHYALATGVTTGRYAALTAIAYRGAAFVIHAAHVPTARAVMDAEPSFATVDVHVATVSFTAPVYRTVLSLPKLGILDMIDFEANKTFRAVQYTADAKFEAAGAWWTVVPPDDVLADRLIADGYRLIWVPPFEIKPEGPTPRQAAILAKIAAFADAGGVVLAMDTAVQSFEGWGVASGGLYDEKQLPTTRFQTEAGIIKNGVSTSWGNGNPDEQTRYADASDPIAQHGGVLWTGIGGGCHLWRPRVPPQITSGPRPYRPLVHRAIYTFHATDATGLSNDWDVASWRYKDGDTGKGRIYYIGGEEWKIGFSTGLRVILNSLFVDGDAIPAGVRFEAGPIARDGVIYVGRPGDRGRFVAFDDETSAVRWEAGALLDALPDAARVMYTVSSCGVPIGTACTAADRLAFATGNATNVKLQASLDVTTAAAASTVIAWQRSGRFGAPASRFGPIENSTAALVTPPKTPYWYNFAETTSAERTAIDAYVNAWKLRPVIVMVGAKDGALHAFSAVDGKESWAFVPYDVARRLNQDRTDGVVTAYSDGAPTLADARLGGTWRTVLVAGEGNGGRGVYAVDVTTPIGGPTGGPKPLWHFTDANMGFSYSKPAVVRVNSGGERWRAVFASGSHNLADVGDTVYGVDLAGGQLVWRYDLFDVSAYVSTSVSALETDDPGEPGLPALDGYVDRLFFGDNKGRIWKLDAGGAPVGSGLLFSTGAAIGAERGIGGNIAAAPDMTGRLVLFFGTGGTPDTPPGQDALFAVYADTGAVRSTFLAPPGTRIFSVVYNAGQLIVATGSDLGGGAILILDANTFAVQLEIPTAARVVGSVYAEKGEIYAVTERGQVLASAYTGGGGPPPPPPPPGGGGGPGVPPPGEPAGSSSLRVLSWRQLD